MVSEAAEQWADDIYIGDESGDQWLYRTTYFDQTFALWHGFGRELRQLSAHLSDANARQKVLRIADNLDTSAA